ncbi:MAG: hypothetical protein D4R44_01130 [Actinobacteria bacterium]|nr:MAG: hypothetical protein D4R44_01130 [Actinomycetota bacterium]
MFTPGSKYFLGLAGLSVASLALVMLLVHPSALGAVALIGLVSASSLLAGLVLFFQDGHVATGQSSAANVDSPTSSIWPLTGAVGLTLLLVGTITSALIFIFGILVLLATLVEWTVQAWSERASSDVQYNATVRRRLLNPIEFPVLAALVLGVIIFSFSRIMHAVSRETGPILFIAAGVLVSIAGVFLAVRPALNRRIVTSITVVAALVLVAGGIVGLNRGDRAELVAAAAEDHYAHRECGKEKSAHFDSGVMQTLSAYSGIDATIQLLDGKLTAQVQGIPGLQQTITIRRSTPANIIFRNEDAGEFRLVANLGSSQVTQGVSEKIVTCTQLLPKGSEQFLTLSIPKPSFAQGPYTLTVAGLDGPSILVVVP